MSGFSKILAVATVMLSVSPVIIAREINVRGIVTNKSTGEPLISVCVYNAETNKLLGSTNDEGRYTVTADDDASLVFSILGCEDYTVPVNGRLNIDVALERSSVTLEEVVVEAKRVTSTVLAEPTDIDVVGNYLHIKTRVKVPHELFSSHSRIIIQPLIVNVTRKEQSYLDPVVFDGWRYDVTQERMLDFDITKDPLHPYSSVKKTGGRTDDVIPVVDSLFVENPNEDFRCDVMMAIENYNSVVYRDTTMIARGTVNPLRFLEYVVPGCYVTDKNYLPTPEMQLRDTKGDVNLTFRVNQSKLDLDEGNNRAEMNALISQLHDIENNPNSALKSFMFFGTSSPEGNYDSNLQLAKRRMESAMGIILAEVNDATRRQAEMSTEASVETWERVVEMLRADGRNDEADAVETVMAKYPDNRNLQSRRISTLPIYGMLKETYLPRLRRVSYQYVSSQYRYLTDAEIQELYRTNSKELSRYEFWRLYTQEDSLPERERIIRRALEVHPRFIVAAADLAAMMIDRGEPDETLLEPLLSAPNMRVPDEARANQAVAYMAAGHFSKADSIASELPDTEQFHKAKIYAMAMNGRYREVMQEISEDSPFNEVLLLLAIKADDQAWKKAQNLGGSAREEYVKAVAANRVDQYMAAINHLENALSLDPSLREVARVDGDVLDLLEDE